MYLFLCLLFQLTVLNQKLLSLLLRLLTLWFDYGQWPGVNDIMGEGIKSIQIDNWLQVIPQLIARIDTPRLLVQRLVHQLLVDIGKAHPQVRKSAILKTSSAILFILIIMCLFTFESLSLMVILSFLLFN